MSKPATPTVEEIDARKHQYRWEYDQDSVDVSQVGDPPNSRKPIIQIMRRIVSDWEYVADE